MASSKRKVVIKDYYILIYVPEHARAMGKGYVAEQVLVAEKVLGRKLTPDEDVRHINGNVHDNRPSNLEVTSSNSGYKTKSVLDQTLEGDLNSRKPTKDFMPCRFQKECWKEVRLPIVKKTKVFLPYICSYQNLSDVYVCPIFWSFIDKELEGKEEVELKRE